MNLSDVTITPQLLANAAAAVSILTVLFASPLVLGCYVVVQRSAFTQLVWFGGVVLLLATAAAAGVVGLVLLG